MLMDLGLGTTFLTLQINGLLLKLQYSFVSVSVPFLIRVCWRVKLAALMFLERFMYDYSCSIDNNNNVLDRGLGLKITTCLDLQE